MAKKSIFFSVFKKLIPNGVKLSDYIRQIVFFAWSINGLIPKSLGNKLQSTDVEAVGYGSIIQDAYCIEKRWSELRRYYFCYLTIILRNRAELILWIKIFSPLQLSMSKCAASFAIAFSRWSSHYENSKSTSGYLCKLKQILVDFLRASNCGKFLPGS